jgi:curved DNA-binding protein CbpA
MTKIRTFYDELGVGTDAGGPQIKRAFKDLAKGYHPDHNPPDRQEWAHEQMSRLNFIVDILLDDASRQEYDLLVEEYQRQIDRPRRTQRQEYALQVEYARLSVEIINLGEKYSNPRLKIFIGWAISGVAILALLTLTIMTQTATFLVAFAQFLVIVGGMIAGFGVSDYLGRGHYRQQIDELELKRSDLRRRIFEV